MTSISVQALVVGTGCTALRAGQWLSPIQSACDKFSINTPKRVAAFLANIGVESNGLVASVENLNYGAQGLANTWDRYSYTGKRGGPPNNLALKIERKPEAIANNTYASRLGNGDEASGDGWKYRGRGLMQLTGRANYAELEAACGLPLVEHPDLLLQPEAATMSAAWFFKTRGCNEAADLGDFNRVVFKINGAAPGAANHGPLRLSRYVTVLPLLT